MVEKAGTGSTTEPLVIQDWNERALFALYESKPKLPHPCTPDAHEQYIENLAAYYVMLLEKRPHEAREATRQALKDIYLDGWTAREFTF